jgi:hypothetical protein
MVRFDRLKKRFRQAFPNPWPLVPPWASGDGHVARKNRLVHGGDADRTQQWVRVLPWPSIQELEW